MRDHEDRLGLPYLVFACADYRFALASTRVETILDAPTCRRVPGAPAHAAGVIPHGGRALLVYDVRRRIGLPSIAEETRSIIETLALRKQDHLRWLSTLRAEVEQGAHISVQTDPHKCAFGKWYDRRSFANYLVRQYMDKFDAPHQAIHAVAERAARLLLHGDREGASALIGETEATTLKQLVWLFDGIGALLHQNERGYVIVCRREGGDPCGLLVDELCELSPLDQLVSSVAFVSGAAHEVFTRAVGRFQLGGERADVLVFDLERFIDEEGSAP